MQLRDLREYFKRCGSDCQKCKDMVKLLEKPHPLLYKLNAKGKSNREIEQAFDKLRDDIYYIGEKVV